MSTRIDFYVLPEDSPEGPLPTACRLCEKAVTAGTRVHVHIPDEETAAEFDRLLWVYKQNSFLGHQRAGTPDADLAAVLIGGAEPAQDAPPVLLNLADAVPPFFQRFERVLEIVHGDGGSRARSRARFKHYRDAGLSPESHKL
jgi:DNA polymerase-3 subunit chi